MQVYGTAETNSTFKQCIYEEKDAALDDYTFLMTNSAVYGAAFEIGAFSKIYGKRVIVYVQNGKKMDSMVGDWKRLRRGKHCAPWVFEFGGRFE